MTCQSLLIFPLCPFSAFAGASAGAHGIANSPKARLYSPPDGWTPPHEGWTPHAFGPHHDNTRSHLARRTGVATAAAAAAPAASSSVPDHLDGHRQLPPVGKYRRADTPTRFV